MFYYKEGKNNMADETKKKTNAKKTVAKKTAKTKKSVAVEKKPVGKKTSSGKKTAAVKKPAVAKPKETKPKKVVSEKPAKEMKKVAAGENVVVKKVNKNNTTFLKMRDVKRKWIILDASGKPLGRVAALAASLLRGKHKVDFTPHVDCGDGVIVINCKDTVLTGKKLYQKIKYHHSGWIGGMKEVKYSVLMKFKPQEAMAIAIRGMLPHNSLGRRMAKHLKTYKDAEHDNKAQNPQLYEF